MTDTHHLPAPYDPGIIDAELIDDDNDDYLPELQALHYQSEQIRAAYLLGFTNPNTKEAYRRDLDQWFAFCRSHGIPPIAARRLHIDAYVQWMVNNPPDHSRRPDPAAPHRPATIARKISAVRGFYAYAVDEELLARTPVPTHKRLNLPKVSRKSQTLGPDKEEASRLLAAARARSLRDGAVLSVLLYAGLRASELCSRNVEHMSQQRGHRVLTVLRKGGEEQDLVLAPPAAAAVDAYLAERDNPATGPLVLGDDGQRLNRHAVAYIVQLAATTAGLSKRISPHSLRHACTTLLLDANVSLRDVQVFMGHSHSTTTERYDLGREQLDKSPAYKLVGVFS